MVSEGVNEPRTQIAANNIAGNRSRREKQDERAQQLNYGLELFHSVDFRKTAQRTFTATYLAYPTYPTHPALPRPT